MAYTKLNLKTGDLVTADVFAHIEYALDTNAMAIITNRMATTNAKKVADAAATKEEVEVVKATADDAAPKSHTHVAADITDLEAYVDARIAAAAAAAGE